MLNDYTKTDRFLILIQTICQSPHLSMSEEKIRDILGHPSRAQWYKLKQELTTESGQRKALLIEKKEENGSIFYQLNQSDWYSFLEGTQELQFVINSYRELGHLFPRFDTEGLSASSKNIHRKFHYLCKIKANKSLTENNNHVETIIRALVGNRKLLIDYRGTNDQKAKTIDIYPLTIVQYKDDLYLMAYKSEMREDSIRVYKISRIEKIQNLKETFKYPLEKNWNPEKYFESTSGIINGKPQRATFRVYGNSKKILSEKTILNSEVVKSTKDYDEYQCEYTNLEEFVGLLFIYGQDIEIVSDLALKKSFIDKAKKTLERNS